MTRVPPAPIVRARTLRHNRSHADNKATVSSGSDVTDNRATGGIIVMKFTRLAAGAIVALAALTTSGLIAGPAGADPTNAKKGQVFNVTCRDLGTVEIATNGSGDWTPVHLTAGNQVLVPYGLHVEFTPVGGETQTLDLFKPAPKNATLDVCMWASDDSDGSFRAIANVAVRS
jgi:hypothetical protein